VVGLTLTITQENSLMKSLRQFIAILILTCAVAVSTYAGDMDTPCTSIGDIQQPITSPGDIQNPATAAGEMHTGITSPGEIPNDVTSIGELPNMDAVLLLLTLGAM
jgi:hypothetical protein